ncbi:hypothetical protein IV88_GL000599 [Pediococcus argentinicus]|uniref:Integral membrane protein n=2 Tax=Pediococcus argentinicus TaxID=480391 RepID=A0A0R2NN81_9LACO|nr:hypothetical protein IV88_GL000599 [Pediococcus argentinicus]
MEAFTDAIIAIVATIMVLEIHAPHNFTFESFKNQVPSLIAYIISFLQIMVSWYNYHLLFKRAKRVDFLVYLTNMIWLLMLSGMPFVTAWVGEYPTHWQPELAYLTIMSLWTGMYSVTSFALQRDNRGQAINVDPENNFERGIRYGCLIVSFIVLPFWPPIALALTYFLFIESIITCFRTEDRWTQAS